METIIYLTRHGQTEWNIEKRLQGRGNSPLTASGIKRAEELAQRVKTLEVDVIITSPIERALHTAKILKGESDKTLVLHDGLREMSFGDYEGRVTEEVMSAHPEWSIEKVMQGDLTMRAPNGETLQEVRERVNQAMNVLLDTYKGKTMLMVAHGITLKALMHYFGDTEVNSEVMGQATLTKIIVQEDGCFVIAFKNDGTHFTEQQLKQGW